MHARLFAAGVSLAAAHGCVAEFHCSEDSNCDLRAGGRCVASVCQYDGAATGGTDASTIPEPTGETGSSSDPGTASDPNTSTAADTTTAGDTDAPAACKAWDNVYSELPGKATGLALTADGGVLVAGVTANLGAPAEIRVMHLSPAGAERWAAKAIAVTENAHIDDDSDLWARVFLPDPAGDEMTVVYIRRILEDGPNPQPIKYGPYVRRFAVGDGAGFPVDDGLEGYCQSIRGVVMPDPATLLLAGDRQDNIWYQRATLVDALWTKAWASYPEPFNEAAGYNNPAITQAIAPLADGVLVGGSWDEIINMNKYRGWLRRLAGDGGVACEDFLAGVGIMAMAPAADGSVYLAGTAQHQAQTQVWLGKLDPACPLDIATPGEPGSSIPWQDHEPGIVVDDDYFTRPELFRDVALAIAPLANGDVLIAGAVDQKPWVRRYSAAGDRLWTLDDATRPGAVLALAVSPDERCLTIAGSDDYFDFNHRVWSVRQLPLDG